MATNVSLIPEDQEGDKKESLFFQEERESFKAEIIFCYAGVLFLEGYDYKAKYRRQIELLANSFEAGSYLDEILRNAGYIKVWEKINGILIPMGNIPVLVRRYYNDIDTIVQELESQIKRESHLE